jgi:Phage tail assembly chaperone protein, TAC
MGLACGVMGWPPAAFWNATPVEVLISFNGWQRVHAPPPPNIMSRDRMATLFEKSA